MNNKQILRWMAAGFLVSALSACSTIKSWFPDKERDYQFTAEIPELTVPDDLKNRGMASLAVQPGESEPEVDSRRPVEAEVARGAVQADAEATQTNATASAPERKKIEVKPETREAEQAAAPEIIPDSNASSLQVDQAKTPATRMVGRALSRKQLEIVERNIDKGYFYVKFDPNAVEAKDESLWDELNFMFGDDPSQEQEYRISVRQVNEQQSEVTVQDSGGKSLSNAVANALLKLITDGINEVVKQDSGQEVPKENGEQKAAESPAAKE